jgi:hypothetical protein
MLIPPHGDLVTIRNLNTYVTFYELRSKSNESQHWDPFVLPIDTSRARYRGPDQDFRNNTYARPEGLWLPSSISLTRSQVIGLSISKGRGRQIE